jgi:hypothetical protein
VKAHKAKSFVVVLGFAWDLARKKWLFQGKETEIAFGGAMLDFWLAKGL